MGKKIELWNKQIHCENKITKRRPIDTLVVSEKMDKKIVFELSENVGNLKKEYPTTNILMVYKHAWLPKSLVVYGNAKHLKRAGIIE